MARVKLSEFRAKKLLAEALGYRYTGLSIDLRNPNYHKEIQHISKKGFYVVKVDQAIKKRGKAGLVALNRTREDMLLDIKKFSSLGFHHLLVEPYCPHDQAQENYLSFMRDADETRLSYSPKGGIDVESHHTDLRHSTLTADSYDPQQNKTGLNHKLTSILYELFQKTHMTLLEINPFIIRSSSFLPLDAAVEVDSAAQFFVDNAWTDSDIREPKTLFSQAEARVNELNSKSPASLSLKVLNPNGSLFLLLSGGGASVVVADELSQLGYHDKIANYGEYSGNPSEDETYEYTKEILKLMLQSKSTKKVLIIAGGVANFTDVGKTFAGIIRAMKDSARDIKKQNVQVFVRRGGPNQEKGLTAMDIFLEKMDIGHHVYGPDKSLASVVARAAKAAA